MDQSGNGNLQPKTGADCAEKDGSTRELEETGKMTQMKIQGKLKKKGSSC